MSIRFNQTYRVWCLMLYYEFPLPGCCHHAKHYHISQQPLRCYGARRDALNDKSLQGRDVELVELELSFEDANDELIHLFPYVGSYRVLYSPYAEEVDWDRVHQTNAQHPVRIEVSTALSPEWDTCTHENQEGVVGYGLSYFSLENSSLSVYVREDALPANDPEVCVWLGLELWLYPEEYDEG